MFCEIEKIKASEALKDYLKEFEFEAVGNILLKNAEEGKSKAKKTVKVEQ